MGGGLFDGLLRIGEGVANELTRGGGRDSGGNPDRVDLRGGGGFLGNDVAENRQCQIALLGQGVNRSFLNRRPRIAKQLGQRRDIERFPIDLQSARILNRRSLDWFDAINRAEDVGFFDLRGRASKFVPAAGVDDQH